MDIFPSMMYGTAWKEEDTESLVCNALNTGYRAIDTACQRKHYYEAAVGYALSQSFQSGLSREDIFIQTKLFLRNKFFRT